MIVMLLILIYREHGGRARRVGGEWEGVGRGHRAGSGNRRQQRLPRAYESCSVLA